MLAGSSGSLRGGGSEGPPPCPQPGRHLVPVSGNSKQPSGSVGGGGWGPLVSPGLALCPRLQPNQHNPGPLRWPRLSLAARTCPQAALGLLPFKQVFGARQCRARAFASRAALAREGQRGKCRAPGLDRGACGG